MKDCGVCASKEFVFLLTHIQQEIQIPAVLPNAASNISIVMMAKLTLCMFTYSD